MNIRATILYGLKLVISVTAALYLIFSVPTLVLAALLLQTAETIQGRLFALATLSGIPSLILLWLSSYLPRRQILVLPGMFLAGTAILLLLINFHLTATGTPLPGSPVRSCFNGTAAYQRACPANLVPEIDQLLLATYVIPRLDPLMDKRNTLELRGQIQAVYGELNQSPDITTLGSVMSLTYLDLFQGKRPIGHHYEYIPPSATNGPLPVILFLHGSLGNFQGYLWVWKKMADLYGFALVAPTFGAGNWDMPGGLDAVEAARQYCSTHPRMDPNRIYLAGLSNGGRGVCLGAGRSPEAYRGLIFISPVLEPDLMLTPAFLQQWHEKPILIIHGDNDNRIPLPYLLEAIQTLSSSGLHVESHILKDQTHFLFFSARDQVSALIGTWIRKD